MTGCLAHFPWAIGSTPSGRLRAQRYAYHFFFRRMIELPGFRRAQIPALALRDYCAATDHCVRARHVSRARLRVRGYFARHPPLSAFDKN